MTILEATEFLGLRVPFSESELRAAFHRRARERHPDVSPEVGAHLQMIGLNQAYSLLKRQVAGAPDGPSAAPASGADYQLYRRGSTVFEKIHPSQWVKVTAEGLFDPSALEHKGAVPEALQAALQHIAEAYQIFSELLNEHPDSLWAPDAKDKLKALDRMVVRYRRMAENSERNDKGRRVLWE